MQLMKNYEASTLQNLSKRLLISLTWFVYKILKNYEYFTSYIRVEPKHAYSDMVVTTYQKFQYKLAFGCLFDIFYPVKPFKNILISNGITQEIKKAFINKLIFINSIMYFLFDITYPVERR